MGRHPEWLLTPERAAVHLPTATAVIADLHLGYALVRQRRGEAVPADALDEALAPLRLLRARQQFDRLVIAGDLFEDGRAAPAEGLIDWLNAAGITLAGIIPGNHDRGLRDEPDCLPIFPDGMDLGGWRVVHGDGPLPDGPVVQGHVHPCLRWGSGVVAPCYLEGPRHLVLPAFSADAAGVNVLRDPRWQHYRCHAVSGKRVLDFGELAVLGRRTQRKGRRR
ncbi:MAG TPA: metallophosphoesterase [Gemmataceae bacterium]|nr:metallophosphoesterase [Gemmataceae bacterium]